MKQPIDVAFNDIKIAITSDIVHKYLLSNAQDIQAIVALARLGIGCCIFVDG